MSSLFKLVGLALALTQTAAALPQLQAREDSNSTGTCESTVVRKPWDSLTSDEKSAYINGELCLMAAPERLGVEGATSVWDDLQYVHLAQVPFIHGVGAFLPWHRYFMAVHASLLREECNYTGPLPYWNEPADVDTGIANATILQDDSFGPDGSGDDYCVQSGPFANLTLYLDDDGNASESYCLSRALSDNQLAKGEQSVVDDCVYNQTTFEDAWSCFESNGPHGAGHGGIGGTMLDMYISPGDPTFFLHHTYLDSVFYKWQLQNLTARLTEIGGTNRESRTYDGDANIFYDYDGDEGNTTTLSHVLWMADLAENLTIADVMDVTAYPLCAEYVFPDDA